MHLILLLACGETPLDTTEARDTGEAEDTDPGDTGETGDPGETGDTGDEGPCEVLVVSPPSWGGGEDGYRSPDLAWTTLVATEGLGDCGLEIVGVGAGFDLAELEATGAEALLLSAPAAGGVVYTEDELAAIRSFADAGNGIVGTYWWTLGHDAHADLGDLFGFELPGTTISSRSAATTFTFEDPTHPLASGLGETFEPGGHDNAVDFEADWATGAFVVAQTAGSRPGAIWAHEGGHRAVMFTTMVEYDTTSPQGLQVLYNALVWAAGETP